MPIITPLTNSVVSVEAHGEKWQHRVYSSHRRILYPDLHPLARHLRSSSSTEEHLNEATTSSSISKQESFVDNDEVDELLVLDNENVDSNSIQHEEDRSSLFYDIVSNDSTENANNQSSSHSQDMEMIDVDNENYLYQPIRIRAVLNEEDGKFLTNNQKKYLLNDIISPALTAWSSALSVVPVIEDLKVEKAQLYDEMSCGPGIGSGFPSPIVPQDHLKDGIPDTDLVVYISISRFANMEDDELSLDESEGEMMTEDDVFKSNMDEIRSQDTDAMDSSDLSSSLDDILAQEDMNDNIDGKLALTEFETNEGNMNMTCDASNSIVSIEGSPYMLKKDKFVFCGNEWIENISNVTECFYDEHYQNDTSIIDSITVTPCASNEKDDMLFKRNDTNTMDIPFFKCFEILNDSNVTVNAENAFESYIISCDSMDMILNRTAVKEEESLNVVNKAIPLCPSSALASAVYCSTDQFDRPVAGTLNYCIDDFFFSEENLERNILTTMHELAHILGMNSLSLAHFRHTDGTPITERDEFGDVMDKEVECTGIDSMNMSIPLPSSDILSFRTVRDVRVADVVTPTVRQVVANQFDCQSIHGAELEHGDVEENVCIGSHWSRRVFRTELMNPILDDVPFSLKISPITLAYFKDSGWYQIDASRSSSGNAWGRGAGCAFVDNKCVSKNGEINATNAHFFCNERRGKGDMLSEIHGCSSDFSKKAVCSLVDYEVAQQTIPDQYQYFFENYGPLWGGSDADLDFCPVFTGYSNGQCNDESSIELKLHPSEKFGLSNSRCVYSEISLRKTSLCVPMACVISDQTLRLKVDGKWEVCEEEGQVLDLRGRNSDHIICPNPSRACPSFYCPRNCLEIEGGICDYDTGKCMCSSETVNCTNSSVYEKLKFVDNVTEMAIYFTNATVLANDRVGFFEKTQIAFEKMTTKQILIVLFFLVLGVLLVIMVVYSLVKQLEKKRIEDKEKMVAAMLVDLRVRTNDTRRRRNERNVRERRRILENHIRKKMGRRYPSTENSFDEIILSTDSFSTAESTMPSKYIGNDNSVDLDSLSDNNTIQNSDLIIGIEESNGTNTLDLSFREGLDGNLYCDYEENELERPSNFEFEELRRRNRSSVFRDKL